MNPLNFFKKRSALIARIEQLESEATHYRRVIGGYQGSYTRFLNKLKPHCKDCEHVADSLEDV